MRSFELKLPDPLLAFKLLDGAKVIVMINSN